jgi:UDP-N-acetylmuramyl tripeptide synthase
VAERVDPGIVPGLAAKLDGGSILITGTNGKTTTSQIVRRIVRAAGTRPVANREGSNMMRGIAAALAEAARWRGTIESAAGAVGVFEVDEAAMPAIAEAVKPRAVLFTNLFRDQLDRYGEVETVAALWQEAVSAWPPNVAVALNADDPSVSSLRDHLRGHVVSYGLEDLSASAAALEHAADARWCRTCGSELRYSAVFYGHIGHWACTSCGKARVRPDVAGTRLVSEGDRLEMDVETPAGAIAVSLPLTGLYNAYNVLGAIAGALALDIEIPAIEEGLAKMTAAFGRQERIKVGSNEVEVILAKNPAGLNQVLRTITKDPEPKDIAFLLNDRIADGRDISWIWDVDFELLQGRLRSLTVSGDRAWDMALRIKYAGLTDTPQVETDTASALRRALEKAREGGRLYVIPTYTAMLEVRNILGRWSGKGAFWEGGDR